MKKLAIALVAVAAILAAEIVSPARALAEKVTILAAASTKTALDRVAKEFTEETNIEVAISPGPSSGLAKQIDQGAAADIFLSADQANADFLEGKGHVSERRNLLTNRLVVIVPADSKLKLTSLADLGQADVKKIAVGAEKVPVGEYSREAFKSAKMLEKVEKKFVGGVDVKATLQYVIRGEVEAGLVYTTDTRGVSKVKIAFEVDPSLHKPIEYPLVLVKREAISDAARKFYEYLAGERATAAFEDAGFGMIREKAP